jgi:hypothetical protein
MPPNLLHQEDEASVRGVLGHFMFVYIHPYMDGNGRMGRFLMNLMLASGGYPWTIFNKIKGSHVNSQRLECLFLPYGAGGNAGCIVLWLGATGRRSRYLVIGH